MSWQRFWQKIGLLNILLLPISIIYYILVFSRKKLYEYSFISSYKSSLPTIVIGNINVGGAGKTPLVIALGHMLDNNNIKYGVISKGYGGEYEGVIFVNKDDSARIVGDEPLLIKIKCKCPVVIAKRRIDAAKALIKKFPDLDVIVTDDGLQHYALQRDIEICVVNDDVGFGNGLLLPSGGLREPVSRLKEVDFIVNNGDITDKYNYLLTDIGWFNSDGEKRAHNDFSHQESQNLALSGIAHPNLFFKHLLECGINSYTKPLPDHFKITAADLPLDKTILMTEKDWVKAKEFNHNDIWYLSVEAILSEAFKVDFLYKLKQLLR